MNFRTRSNRPINGRDSGADREVDSDDDEDLELGRAARGRVERFEGAGLQASCGKLLHCYMLTLPQCRPEMSRANAERTTRHHRPMLNFNFRP